VSGPVALAGERPGTVVGLVVCTPHGCGATWWADQATTQTGAAGDPCPWCGRPTTGAWYRTGECATYRPTAAERVAFLEGGER